MMIPPVRAVRLDQPAEVPAQSWSSLCWSRLAEFSRQSALQDGLTGRSYSLAEARELAARAGSGLLRSDWNTRGLKIKQFLSFTLAF